MLILNEYPSTFIEQNIKTRLQYLKYKSKFNNKNTHKKSLYQKMPKIQLPFTHNYERISSIFKQYNITTIPTVNKSMNSVIKSGKDKSDKWDQTGVVYKFTCKNCPATYIGETKRSLKTRINEHKKNKNIEYVIHTHRNSLNHEFN